MMNKLLLIASSALSLTALPAAAQTTLDWNFSGTHTGMGQLSFGADGVVTAFSGTYNGQTLSLVTFTNDPNNPPASAGDPSPGLNNNNGNGLYTYHGVPNTGGVDYIFDNNYPLTSYGILVSTGTGDNERVYDPSLTGGVPDFFSVNPDGSYVHDFGTFATTGSTSAVPEPATWAMMLLGFGIIGFGLRARRTTAKVNFA